MKNGWQRAVKIAVVGLTAIIVMVVSVLLLQRNGTEPEVALINYDTLGAEFLDNYFAESAELAEKGDPENILIVMSMETPEIYGAVDMVEGPNHMYYLQYDSTAAKDEALEKLKSTPGISVEENITFEIMEPGDLEAESASYSSWGIEAMGLDKAIAAVGNNGQAVKVAVIDSGLNTDVFKANYAGRTLETYDVNKNTSGGNIGDDNSHGTHVTGIVAEGTPANVSILAIRATTGTSGSFSLKTVNDAIYYAVNHNADVINMSLGGYAYSPSQNMAIQTAASKGIVNVASAGNEATDQACYPASYNNVISVSALKHTAEGVEYDPSYSNFGPGITFAAPGTQVNSLSNVSITDKVLKSGTSMASPHAAAAVAILKSYNKNVNYDASVELLKSQADDLGATGWDTYYGNGAIDFKNSHFCVTSAPCETYGVFASGSIYAGLAADEVVLTPYNYGTVYNILASKVRMSTATGEVTRALYQLDGVNISGYDPYAAGTQQVTVRYDGMETKLAVTNPADYALGWEYEVNDGQATITKYLDNGMGISNIVVPATLGGVPVVAFADAEPLNSEGELNLDSKVFGATGDFEEFVRVALPESLTRIGANTFSGAYALTTLEMPGMTEVGRLGLAFTYSLKQVDLPNTLTSLGQLAFWYSGLASLDIPANLTEIDETAFYMCGSIAMINVDDNNPKYYDGDTNNIITKDTKELVRGGYVLAYDTTYGWETIPSEVEKIGFGAFSDASSIVSLDLNNPNLTSIDETAFIDRDGENLGIIFYVLNNSPAQEYMHEHEFAYYTFYYTYADVTPENKEYKEGDTVDPSNINVVMRSDWAEVDKDGKFIEHAGKNGRCLNDPCKPLGFDEEGEFGGYTGDRYYYIEYPNGNSFKNGDTYYTVVGYYNYGGDFSQKVAIKTAGGEPEPVVIEAVDRTNGKAVISSFEHAVSVTAAAACMIVGERADGTFARIDGVSGGVNGGNTTYAYSVPAEFKKVHVVIKGDVNLDGKVSLLDSNKINRSQLSQTAAAYKALNEFEKVLADVNKDGKVSLLDSNMINRSQLSKTAVAYKEISW